MVEIPQPCGGLASNRQTVLFRSADLLVTGSVRVLICSLCPAEMFGLDRHAPGACISPFARRSRRMARITYQAKATAMMIRLTSPPVAGCDVVAETSVLDAFSTTKEL